MMGRVILELANVGKRLNNTFALEDISIDLQEGEVHFITGENGSGKSALMKIISGRFMPDSGGIVLDGQSVCFGSINESRRAGIVYQTQDVELFDNLTVAENVYFTQLGHGMKITMDSIKLGKRCQSLFDHLGVELNPTDLVSTLGYAQKLIVSACATFVAKGRVVIFDEPTAGMGEKEREVFLRIVAGLRRRGAGIFYISHRLDEVPLIGDRLTVMQRGRVCGHMESVDADRPTIIKMMIGHNCPERYPRLDTKPGSPVLSVERLSSAPALVDVSFRLHQGEILGLTGLMGSGRTRLANCLFGVNRPDGGVIRIGSEAVKFRHPAGALTRGIAMIPEDRARNAIFDRQDALCNLVTAALERFNTRAGLNPHYMEELSNEYFKSFGVAPNSLYGLINLFSGGNQQKIVIARWMMSMARIFIMDEPTRGIDAASRVDIYNGMNDLVSKGASILLISSDTEELLGMCDRILVLAGGVIVNEFNRKEATKEKLLDSSTEG